MAAVEVAATNGPGGPERAASIDASWLILQRLDDLRRAQDEVRVDLKALGAKVERQGADLDAKMERQGGALDAKMERHYTALDAKMDRLRGEQRWFIGVLLVAILGLLTKVLLPGA